MDVTEQDYNFMRIALDEARCAMEQDEVPVGAVVVCKGHIIGRGHNLTEALGDVTAHAEMQAITAACNTIGGKYLPDCTLYVTVEPCLMCAGAIGWSQMGRIVIGAPDEKRGYYNYVIKSPFHPKATVVTGVMKEECEALMKQFFQRKRK